MVSFTSDIWSSSQLAGFLHGRILLSLSEIWEQRALILFFPHPLLDCTHEAARFLSELLEKWTGTKLEVIMDRGSGEGTLIYTFNPI